MAQPRVRFNTNTGDNMEQMNKGKVVRPRTLHMTRIATTLLGALGCAAVSLTAGATTTTSPTLLAALPGGTGLSTPVGHLLQGSDGNLYGAAMHRNSTNSGGVFSVSMTGAYTDLYDIDPAAQQQPFGGLFQAGNGELYGTLVTTSSGTAPGGVVFSLTTGGQYDNVHTFASATWSGLTQYNSDGASPETSLVQGPDGTLYGVTYSGGESGTGTLYSISSAGSFSLLYTFSPTGALTGTHPNGSLVFGSDGNLYGTTMGGGDNGTGTIYRVTPGGGIAQIFSFPSGGTGSCSAAEFAAADGTLTAGANGKLYGVLCSAGTNAAGLIYSFDPSTTTFTALHDFGAGSQGNITGWGPNGPLVLGADGNLYGSTGAGGTFDNGAIFELTPDGSSYKVLYSFNSANPLGYFPRSLVLGSDNNLYGTTTLTGSGNNGAVFRFPYMAPNDVVMTSASTGALDLRLINQAGAQQVLQTVAKGYYPVAVADFNGDGFQDILWTSANNDLYLWLGGKNGSNGFTPVYMGKYPAGWSVIGAGDIDGDGNTDLYWINTSTHQFGYWLMDGTTIKSTYATSYTPGYYPIAEGDFNGDGKLDVLWSSANNDLYMWTSNGTSGSSRFTVAYGGSYPVGWKLAGVGDLDGDGKSDLVWMKADGSQWGYWLMNGVQRKSIVAVSNAGAESTTIVAVDDYNHDGLADLVWSNGSNLILSTNAGTCASQCTFTPTTLTAPATGMTVFKKNVPNTP